MRATGREASDLFKTGLTKADKKLQRPSYYLYGRGEVCEPALSSDTGHVPTGGRCDLPIQEGQLCPSFPMGLCGPWLCTAFLSLLLKTKPELAPRALESECLQGRDLQGDLRAMRSSWEGLLPSRVAGI